MNDEAKRALSAWKRRSARRCTRERFLDLIENFIVFEEHERGYVKKTRDESQYLG